jgi:MFS family permease
VGFGLLGVLGMIFQVTRDSWRWVMLAGAAPALLAIFIAMFVPESERWKSAVKAGAAHPCVKFWKPAAEDDFARDFWPPWL